LLVVSSLGRVVLLAMIPVNVVMVLWVWMGRIVFGVGGWFLFILAVSVVPLMLLALAVTTVLAYTQPGRPRSLTTPQAWAQLATWFPLLLAGAVMPDFGDAPDSEASSLTKIFGWSRETIDLSFNLAVAFAGVATVAYLVLLVLLVFGRRREPATA
jgi:hypothetical protein